MSQNLPTNDGNTSSLIPVTIRHIGKNVVIQSDKANINLRKGILRFFGDVQFAQGKFCGIELDKATGKNNGSIQGIRYFQCPPNFGIFVPSDKVFFSNSSSQNFNDYNSENTSSLIKKNLLNKKSPSTLFEASTYSRKSKHNSEVKISSESNVWDAINLVSTNTNNSSNYLVTLLDQNISSQFGSAKRKSQFSSKVLKRNASSIQVEKNKISHRSTSNINLAYHKRSASCTSGNDGIMLDSKSIITKEENFKESIIKQNLGEKERILSNKNSNFSNNEIPISMNTFSNSGCDNNLEVTELDNCLNPVDSSFDSQLQTLSQFLIPSFPLTDNLVTIQHFLESNQHTKEDLCINNNIAQLLRKDLSVWQGYYAYLLSQYHQIKVDIDTYCYEHLEALSNVQFPTVELKI